MFDNALVRFATSGTLIGLYGLADWAARRMAAGPAPVRTPTPHWIHALIAASILAFYALIGPFGSALLGGWGNVAGIAVAVAAMMLRLGLRHGSARVRHPATAVRTLFYAALPLAVGVPLGWLALTLPACLLSAYRSLHEDRMLSEQLGEPYRRCMETSHRWIPGVW